MQGLKEKLDAMDKNQAILLIDDDSGILQMLGFILGQLKFKQIHKATNLSSALSLLQTHDIQIIFLDINLGQESGIAAIKSLKEAKQDVKIIMLSGDATPENIDASIAAGAIGFIGKPFNAKKIAQALVSPGQQSQIYKNN